MIEFKCINCNTDFLQSSRDASSYITKNKNHYCSKICSKIYKHKTKTVSLPCGTCNQITVKNLNEFKKSKCGKIFCSKSCSASYHNTHKTTSIRRSKLEVWLESQLLLDFTDINILFNNNTIGSELDIYLPDLKLAFEINGIFHYKPIFGTNKFLAIQKNDRKKLDICHLQSIELHVLDVSNMIAFSPKKSKEIFDFIKEKILIKSDKNRL